MTVLLALSGPNVDHRTVLGTGPWMVVAGLLHALGVVGAYPRTFRPAVVLPVGVVLTFLCGTVIWVVVRQLARVRNVGPSSGRYLAASGTGASVVMSAVLLMLTKPPADTLLWLVTTPVIAAVVAGVGVLSLGVFDPTSLARMRWVSWLVAVGFSTLGSAVAVGIDVFARPATPATRPFVAVGAAAPTAEVSVAWPIVVVCGTLGTLSVSALARIVERRPAVGRTLSVAVAAGTLTPAVALLATVTLR